MAMDMSNNNNNISVLAALTDKRARVVVEQAEQRADCVEALRDSSNNLAQMYTSLGEVEAKHEKVVETLDAEIVKAKAVCAQLKDERARVIAEHAEVRAQGNAAISAQSRLRTQLHASLGELEAQHDKVLKTLDAEIAKVQHQIHPCPAEETSAPVATGVVPLDAER